MDDFRYSRNDVPSMNTLVTQPGNSRANRLSQPTMPQDSRGDLPRLFKSDSGPVSTLSTIVSQNTRNPDFQAELQTLQKAHLLERKKQEYEKLLSQKRLYEAEMERLDQAQKKEEEEMARLQEDLVFGTGHQSQPGTPPDDDSYEETSTFQAAVSRPNRYSTPNILSPTSLFAKGLPMDSQPLAPTSTKLQSRPALEDRYLALPTQARDDDEDEEDDDDKEMAVRQDPTSHRSTNHLNRYSMPVTKSRIPFYDLASLDQANTARFLFGDDEASSSDQFSHQDSNNSYNSSNRNEMDRHGSVGNGADLNPSGRPASIHLSEAAAVAGATGGPAVASYINNAPGLQQSYSANDMPAVNTIRATSSALNNHAQQHLHNHNASIGRVPVGINPARNMHESVQDTMAMHSIRDQAAAYASIGAAMQQPGNNGNGFVQFTPITTAMPMTSGMPLMTPFGGFYQQAQAANALNQAAVMMSNLNLAAPGYQQANVNYGAGHANPMPAAPTMQMVPSNNAAQPRDSQQRVIQSRRNQDTSENMVRYNNKSIADFVGHIYDICKDQFGCRFLQRELDQRRPWDVHAVWAETHQHMVELMMDPFGNYLCQKLLEYCTEEDRTKIIEVASRDMVVIALNQHGTRALQKMIEHVETPHQVAIITDALRNKVVGLIKDLNGNHVIQKCLNKLAANDAGFVFEAVGNNCVEVGTHRHGCCVLQRCIDHAVGDQKSWLVERITENALALVSDPFGNYVVQYIIDLNEPTFTEPLVGMFASHIVHLSKHKFSSNVIEKSLRCALDPSRDMIVSELLGSGEMEGVLKDSYANYVVQTALEYATPALKRQLVNAVRLYLPAIRNTAYARRIQAKINQYDAIQANPSVLDLAPGQVSLRAPGSVIPDVSSRNMLLESGHNNGNLSDPALSARGSPYQGSLAPSSPLLAIEAGPSPQVGAGRRSAFPSQLAMAAGSNTPNRLSPMAMNQAMQNMHGIQGMQSAYFQPMHPAVQGLTRGYSQPDLAGRQMVAMQQGDQLVQQGQHPRLVPPSPASTLQSPQRMPGGAGAKYVYSRSPAKGHVMSLDGSNWL